MKEKDIYEICIALILGKEKCSDRFYNEAVDKAKLHVHITEEKLKAHCEAYELKYE